MDIDNRLFTNMYYIPPEYYWINKLDTCTNIKKELINQYNNKKIENEKIENEKIENNFLDFILKRGKEFEKNVIQSIENKLKKINEYNMNS